MSKQKKMRKWQAILGGLVSVIAAGYGVNIAVGPDSVPLPGPPVQVECVLEYGVPYSLSDGREVYIYSDGVAIFNREENSL